MKENLTDITVKRVKPTGFIRGRFQATIARSTSSSELASIDLKNDALVA